MFRYSLFILFLAFTASASAQSYTSAIGARLGYPLSLSYKTFLGDSGNAVEGIVGYYGSSDGFYRSSMIRISAGYQIHQPLNLDAKGLESLQWYYGGGATVSFWSWNYDSRFTGERYGSTTFGLQGFLGLDYRFPNNRINVSLDWTPVISFNGFGSGFGAGFAGVGVRYVLGE